MRNRWNGSIGFFCRISTTTNAANSAAAPANRPTIRVLPHPSSFPRRSASTRRKSEPLNVATPGQSTPRAAGSRDSAILRNVRTIAAIPIGTFSANTDCQPIPSVKAPPTSGPIATATPIVAPYRPVAIPSSLPLNS